MRRNYIRNYLKAKEKTYGKNRKTIEKENARGEFQRDGLEAGQVLMMDAAKFITPGD